MGVSFCCADAGVAGGRAAGGAAQGTAATEAHELWEVYGLDVRAVPTNRPTSRIDSPSRFFPTSAAKLTWIARVVCFLPRPPPPARRRTVRCLPFSVSLLSHLAHGAD